MEEHYEFDSPGLFNAFSVGAPGKRTFFLGIGEKDNWARIWLEKEHLEVLGPAIKQLFLAMAQRKINVPEEDKKREPEDHTPSGFPFVELEVEQISIGYEDELASIAMHVHGTGPEREAGAEVEGRVTLEQLRELGQETESICAAGRPRCKLCGQPIDPEGHVCPEQN